MTNKTNSKGSARKKLIPAVGMLTVSAMMLSSATYAWFTMAREVEVTNIQMTASVPADLQISLGMLQGLADGSAGLSGNFGTLVPAINNNTADNGGVATPGDDAVYWSNTADISAYYALGKIMPASSTDGLNLYFTPDASGVGKTLKTDAKYYTAVEGATIFKDLNGAEYMSTLHAYTTDNKPATGATVSTAWDATHGYQKGKEWNVTNDDGYFVDIPVWIRSSNDEDVHLSVDAYVTTNAKTDEDDLYLAARAVILDAERTESGGLIAIKEGNYSAYATPGDTTSAKKTTIVNFMSSTNATGAAVQSITENGPATYGPERYYDGTTGNGVMVKARNDSTGKQFGEPTKIWVRVWLEGEDPNCWNENAGQDFNISLKFSRDDVEMPNLNGFQSAASDTNTTNSLVAGTQTTITYPNNGGTITYTFNGNTWVAGSTFKAAPLGHAYKYGDTVITTSSELIRAMLDSTTGITTKALADAGKTLTDVITATPPTSGKFKWNSSGFDLLPTAAADNINSYYVNIDGVETYVPWADSITWPTTELTSGTEYDIRIVYNADAPTYTATYQTLNITSGSNGGALKLLRVDKVTDGTTHDYTWYVAGDNTYVIPTGAKVTTDDNTTGFTSIADMVAALNAASDKSDLSALAGASQVNAAVKTGVDVAIAGDPNAGVLKLTKIVTADVVTWKQQAVGDFTDAEANTYADADIPTGKVLKWTNAPAGTTTTEFDTVAALVTALGNTTANPVVSVADPTSVSP